MACLENGEIRSIGSAQHEVGRKANRSDVLDTCDTACSAVIS